jgi:type 1 glutamine amidotransferase
LTDSRRTSLTVAFALGGWLVTLASCAPKASTSAEMSTNTPPAQSQGGQGGANPSPSNGQLNDAGVAPAADAASPATPASPPATGAPVDAGTTEPPASTSTDALPPSGTGGVDARIGDAVAPAKRGRILVYSRTTGNRHDSIPQAVMTVVKALRDRGYLPEASEEPKWFTKEILAGFQALVFVSVTGKPLGDPGLAEIAALDEYVKGGGILIGLHAASSTFYDPELAYTKLIGGKFEDHPGKVRRANCHATAAHPAVAKLPDPFVVTDEIYVMSNVRPDNQVILTCEALDKKPLPIAWYRREGQGLVFYTALGHETSDWATDQPYFRDHAWPGILWALGE